ncbi:MAG: twitch domain-containing radical SAM protein [Bacteroidota bacterium]
MIDFIEAIKTSFQIDKKYKEAEQKGYHPIDRNLYKAYNKFRPNGAKPLFCYLPYNSLTFSFGGQVFVCSYNRDIELGRYPQNSIDEIWNGAEAQKLREHMWHNDLDYGCRHCKFFFDKEKFTNLRPLVFDKYYKNTDAAFPQVFEFELSNECNLECQMCHGEVSSSIRKNRDKLPPLPMHYDDAFVQQLAKYIPHLKEAKFYGGEPFLISIYYQIWDKVRELNPNLDLFVITNGSHWNSKIEKLVNELNFDVAVSIDAFDKEKVERIRKNVVYEKLIDNIKRFSEICTRKGKHLSLSFTVQQDNWEQLPLIINLCNEVNAFIYVSYLERPVQFALSSLPRSEWKKVREYMNQFSFPRLTSKERHNAKCFEDFKHYLDTYIASDNEKKYHDYKFGDEAVPDYASDENSSVQPVKPLTSSSDFFDWIEKQYAADNTYASIVPKDILLGNIDSILAEYNEDDRAMLRGFMVNSNFSKSLASMQNHPLEQLKKQTRLSLEAYKQKLVGA